MKQPSIEAKTLRDLEWHHVMSAWQSRCGTELGTARVAALSPAASADEATERTALVGELRFLITTGDSPSFSLLPAVSEIASRLDRGGTVKAESLHDVMIQLALAKDLKRLAIAQDRPAFTRFVAALDPMNHLYTLLAESVDEQGELRSSASPELYGLRKRKGALLKELTELLDGIMDRPGITPYLQDRFHTQREERFVLPIKSEFRSEVKGIIHGTSGSGQTVFMEPQEVFLHNNRLKEIQSEIEIEEYRILSRLAGAVAEVTDDLRTNETILTALDAWIAAAKLALAMDATPLTFSTDGGIDLLAARHPLLVLDGVEVVPNDIALERGRVLIITGPNGGGKTVTIKTTGLIFLMARMGLFVPCGRGSVMPFYNRIVTMIGDDQDISSHLSTFSAQIVNMKRVLDESDPDTLAVLDELAVGTDPSQGSVLAQSALEHLLGKGVTTMVTTHFSRLKALAMITEGFVNASVGGKSAVKPDFRLVAGLPGTSEGIAVAERLGLAGSVTGRARELLGEGDNKIDALLAELFAMRTALKDQRLELDREQIALDKERTLLNRLTAEKERELRRLRKEGYEATMEEVVRVRRLVGALEARAKEDNLTPVRRRELKEAVQKVAERVTEKLAEFNGPPVSDTELVRGNRVRSRSFGQVVEVVEISEEGKVLVALGSFKSWLDRGDLEALEQKPEKPAPRREHGTKAPPPPPAPEEDPAERLEQVILTPSNTLDVRGKRMEQAVAELDRHLDAMVLAGQTGCAVIHGYGTGVLRATLRDHLKDSPFVRLFRPGKKGEGGDGVTVILMV